jgi:hypothetical protein
MTELGNTRISQVTTSPLIRGISSPPAKAHLHEKHAKFGFEIGFVPRAFIDSKRHSSFVPVKNSTKNESIPPTLILKDIPVSFLKSWVRSTLRKEMENGLAQSRQGAENRNATALTCYARLGASAPLREILCLSGHAFIRAYRPCFKALSDERALPARRARACTFLGVSAISGKKDGR